MKEDKTDKRWLYAGIIFLLLFVLTTTSVTKGLFSEIDKLTIERVSLYHTNFLTSLFIIYHYAFKTSTLVIITLLMSATFYLLKKKKEAITFAGIMIIDALALYLTKTFTNIIRPLGSIVTESTLSFPSGHTTSAIVFIGLSTYMSIKYLRGEWSKTRIPLVLEIIALSIFVAYSRLYLGIHWFSDIIGGTFLGLTILSIGIFILEEENIGKKLSQKTNTLRKKIISHQ